MECMKINEIDYVLDSIGFVVARSALTRDTVDRLNGLVNKAVGVNTVAKFAIMELDDAFMDLMTHPWVMDVLGRVLGQQFRFDHAFGLQQPVAGANLHGGPGACQGSCFYHNAALYPSVGRVSVGFALTAQSPEIGGFAYIPGSHKSKYPYHGSVVLSQICNNDFTHEAICIPKLEAGDICLFPDCLVHGTAPWSASYTRRVLYYMYSPGYMAWRPYAEIERYTHRAVTDLQRQLLRPPYVAAFDEEDLHIGSNIWRTPSI